MVYWPTKSGFGTKYLHKNRFGFKFLGFLHLAISLENYANLLCALKNGIFITFVGQRPAHNIRKQTCRYLSKETLKVNPQFRQQRPFMSVNIPSFCISNASYQKAKAQRKKMHFPFFHLQASLQVWEKAEQIGNMAEVW